MNERATLKDIASLAGVSLTTVSQTLNNKGAISDTTRTKVMTAAEQLGYQQRVSIAPHLNSQLNTVCMLVKRDPDEKVPNPFHYYVMKGIETECRQLGLELKYGSMSVDENSRAVELPSELDVRNTDAFLIVGAVVEEGQAFLEHVGERPVVFINGYLRGAAYDRIGIDNRAGAYNAAHYLIDEGHRHIGFVGGGKNAHPSINERCEGFVMALREANLEPSYIADSPVNLSDKTQRAAHSLLKAHPHLTAIVAASDNVAMGTFKAASELGLKVPDDLSVVGFDNIHGVEHLSPPLTTMAIDKEYLGVAGVRLLYDTSSLETRPNLTTLIKPSLIIRSSAQTLTKQEV